jgi:hypothetical protein
MSEEESVAALDALSDEAMAIEESLDEACRDVKFGDYEIAGRHIPGEDHYILDKLRALDAEGREQVREIARKSATAGQRPRINSLSFPRSPSA